MAHGSEDAGVPPESPFLWAELQFHQDDVPDKRAGFTRVFKIENVTEVELESAFGFLVALFVSLARMKYLALSDVDLDADEEIHSTSPCVVALEGLYLRGVSPGVIKILAKTLSNPADAPPTLRRLVLTPTFEEGFAEAVVELIIACGSHLTSLAWLPSIYFRESTLIECRPTADKYSSFFPRPNQHIHSPPPLHSPVHHHISKHNPTNSHSPKPSSSYSNSPIAPTPSKKSPSNVTASRNTIHPKNPLLNSGSHSILRFLL